MVRLYNMETGELFHTEEKKVTLKWHEREIHCPSTDLQEVTAQTLPPESACFTPDLVNIEVESFIEQQK